MFIQFETIKTKHTRTSKLGRVHEYERTQTLVILRCDSCREVFSRAKGSMSPARLNNNYFHVCGNCDAKRFAQSKGVEQKQVWDKPVSSLDDISRL